MGYDLFKKINRLTEFVIIGGCEFTIRFNVYDEDGNDLDLTGGSILWRLCQLGDPNTVILEKIGTIVDTNIFEIYLSYVDTYQLMGKFIQQPIITLNSSVIRASQGLITILPCIETNATISYV